MVRILAYFSIALVLYGLATSYKLFHYTTILILGVMLSLLTFSLSLFTDNIKRLRKTLLILAVLLVVFAGSRPLVNGIDEQETTSDTINIFLNGFFRWSIHGNHYDLAPVDSITKVILLRTTGINNIFDPATASTIYVAHGIMAILLLYSFLKFISRNLAPALIGLSLFLYPYSAIVGLSMPPAPLSQLMGVAYLALTLRGIIAKHVSMAPGLIMALFLVYSILAHPSSIGLLLLVGSILIVSRHYIEQNTRNTIIMTLLIGLVAYFSKTLYTAFIQGFAGYLSMLKDYIVQALTTEENLTGFTTRNLGYSALPRTALTGFAVFPAIVTGYTLVVVIHTLRRKRIDVLDSILLSAMIVYGLFFIVAYLTGVGGVSQSRILFNGIQPYVELVFLIHLLGKNTSNKVKIIALLLLVASLNTIITPNAIPVNYTIYMASKAATLNDHINAYNFFNLMSTSYFIELYTSSDISGRIIVTYESKVKYNAESIMAVTYFYIAPKIIDAKSYWDPRILSIFLQPRETEYFVENRIYNGWVHAFLLYTRK
jgi:hypothetical protein